MKRKTSPKSRGKNAIIWLYKFPNWEKREFPILSLIIQIANLVNL